MFDQSQLEQVTELINKRIDNRKPQLGMILGSGLGELADEIDNAVEISYEDLPGLPKSSVSGHAGRLVIGELHGVEVVCLKGRVHYYEGATHEQFKLLIRLVKALGCHSLLITNAAGSLRKEVGPGELVLVNDHINFQPVNPLVGPNDNEAGPRFFPMDDAYDADFRQRFHQSANKLAMDLHDGVYISVLGPNFETPAEIKAFRTLGADVIGMSTVPEVLIAKHCGLRVNVISTITNLACGLADESLTHEGTLHYGEKAASKLKQLIHTFLKENYNEFQ